MQAPSQTGLRRLFVKLRDEGPVYVCRAIGNRLSEKAGRAFRFLTWVFPTLGERKQSAARKQRRLLVIYDLSSQPFSIGDILVFQEAALVIREREQLGEVDFALVYDPQQPASSDPAFAGITEENVLYHMASVLPAAQMNLHLGSLFIFNSHHQLQRFVRQNAELYYVWPPALRIAGREYFYYTVFNELLYNYFKEHGNIPRLSCRDFLVEWAEAFYDEHVYPNVPVTVQIRNNRRIQTHRNLRMDCWLEFFRHCEDRYPVKFIVICSRNEIDDRLHECRNVVIAKDHLTSLEQDLALIHTAAIHMGASSGPGTMAIFGAKPYLLVNTSLVADNYRDMIHEDNAVRFFFADPLQRLTFGAESTEMLVAEFARMFATVDVERWSSSAKHEAGLQKEALTWLR